MVDVHRFVSIVQVVRDTRPSTEDVPTLLDTWGLTHATQECFWVIAFDLAKDLKTVTEVARGGFHDQVVYIPTVLSAVLAAQTDRFWVAHNHPAGPVSPSEEDIDLTETIMAASNVVGLSFEDHVIVGPEGWFSMADEGILVPVDHLGVRAGIKRAQRRKSA